MAVKEKLGKKGDRVQALRMGFYHDRRIREGEFFVLANDGELGQWMKPIAAKPEGKAQEISEVEEDKPKSKKKSGFSVI
jgi:hypothetical protein